ncbi:hypothetical protein PAJL_1551 [Cutibacterium acnes HL042PA3]|nr:hypothetical protein HMPREF9948_2460 [Propionibacterium sp. 434-HC2]ESK58720.1 hypothetical protein PAJL_1551 [Cutibacterium acnes HL042PA3]MCW5114648.1 hypothetical protein [Cutibacterium acnes P05]
MLDVVRSGGHRASGVVSLFIGGQTTSCVRFAVNVLVL